MKFINLVSIAILFCSCSNEAVKNDESKTTKPVTTTCYLAAFNQDTITLQLTDSNNVLTGELNYLPYEKDSRIGRLYNIKLNDDTLFAMYQSTQEAQETFCEMAMLKKNNSYILTNDIWGGDNYTFDTSYVHGKFVAKNKIAFNGDTLSSGKCR